MSISKQIKSSIESSSLIRKMFEEGDRRRQLYGADKVFDFSIGNPIFEPPPEVRQSLLKLLQSDEKGSHRYMPNPGYPQTRSFIAGQLEGETRLPFTADDIVMTVGAGGALNVILKTLLDPGEEVVVLKPYFLEYDAYTANHGGIPLPVDTTEDFLFDFPALERALNPKVKVVLINSPNNPTGVVYPADDLEKLGTLLRRKSEEYGHTISLVSDEPYRNISYEDPVPSIFPYYENCVVGTSYSKDLAIPGERIGYLAISPNHEDRRLVQQGSVIALRILGFVNAPALMQRMLPMVGKAHVDLTPYRKNRDLLYQHLTKIGFSCVKPGGAFYLFPKCPIEDDKAFVESAQHLNLLLVPGSGFGTPGHFRICYCFDTDMVRRSLPIFSELAKQYKMIE
ncbi:MAG: pyridoxal phosphate-dependent aminotransferase [Proteobacteria bacterium]|nr:pyridoxal phosphate-dependent aminotransferase [Pseudomonadota bacterium]